MFKSMSLTIKFVLLIILLIVVNALSWLKVMNNMYQEELRIQAQTVVENVNAFGSWVADHGRVWVKGADSNYLGHEWLKPVNGRGDSVHFYSKNPALAQRELSEVLAKSDAKTRFRMTSDNVMNPKNSPDAFEREAIEQIKALNLDEYIKIEGDKYRYAKRVVHKASCISCHSDPKFAPDDVIERYGDQNGFGFKEGDVAGIISVTVPSKNFASTISGVIGWLEITLIVGSALLVFVAMYYSVIAPIRSLTKQAQLISKGKDVDMQVDDLKLDSSNEIHQLTLAVARMNQSIKMAIPKK